MAAGWILFVPWVFLFPLHASAQDFDIPFLDSFDGGELMSVIRLGTEVTDFALKLFHELSGSDGNYTHISLQLGSHDAKVLNKFEQVTARLDVIDSSLEGVQEALAQLHDYSHRAVRWEVLFDTLQSYVRPIWSLYSRWKEYMNYRNDLERETLDDLASAVVSHHPHSTLSLLWSIHDLVVPHKASIRAGIFQHLKDLIDHDAATCDLGQSPQQLAYGLYKLIAATETKAFAMMTFSWMLLRESGKGNFSRETKLAQLGHVKREEEALMNAREVMENLSRVFWRCDPEVHLEGVTYLQVTDLLQGYIENEVDMNSEGTCTQTCSAYGNGFPDVRTGCTDNRKQKFCSMQRPCNGNIFNCKFIDADAWVCLSDKPERRYGYIEYENGKRLGDKERETCKNMQKVDSWWRWFVHCSYCFCLCDDMSPQSHRHFSLQLVSADPGKVVTGIKFEKVDNIFYLKIQQGYPMAGGEVKPSSVEWKPVDPYETLSAAPKDGYMTLTYEDRAVDLDDLFAPAGHVITGVGFRRLGAHLGLTIQVTPINFTTGELKPDLSYWKSNMNTDASDKNPRKQLPLVDVAVPIYTVFDSVVDSHHDMWLQFGPTSEVKDAAQTTVPFLDAQEVFSRGSTWIDGIGLYHKGRPGYGGFLGLQLFTVDVTPHLFLPDTVSHRK